MMFLFYQSNKKQLVVQCNDLTTFKVVLGTPPRFVSNSSPYPW